MIPIGKLIQEKLEEKGKTVVWLSLQIPCTRANIYKIFNKSSIDTAMLYRISQILEFDFFQCYSESITKVSDAEER